MKLLLKIVVTAVIVMLAAVSISAQSDPFGATDTLFAATDKIDDHNWMVTISLFNDEKIVALSIPLRVSAGEGGQVVVDSVVYTGGRAEHFTLKVFRADTSSQSVTMGLIANMGPTDNTLHAGNGRVATVFVSSLDGNEIQQLDVDTTTTPPSNSLMAIADRVQGGDNADTIPSFGNAREIRPVFVVRQR